MIRFYEVPPKHLFKFKLFLLLVVSGIVLLLGFILSWNYLPSIAIPLLLTSLVLSLIRLEYGLMWFVFLIPLLASLPLILGVSNFYLIEIVFWAVILIWVLRLVRQKEIRFIKTPLDVPLVIFLLIVFGSCVTTLIKINQPFSGLSYGTLGETLHKMFLIDRAKNIPNLYTLRYSLTIFEGIFLYFFLINTIKSKEFVQKLVNIMVLSSVLVAAYGIFQYFTRFHLLRRWARAYPNLTCINATLQDPSSLGSYLVLMIPLLLCLSLSTKGEKRLFFGSTMGALGLCVIFTGSSDTWVSLFLVFVGILLLFYRKDPGLFFKQRFVQRHHKKIILFILIFLLISIVAMVGFSTKANVPVAKGDSYFKVMLGMLNLHQPINTITKARVTKWQAALRMIKDRPFLGQGIGSFFWRLPAYSHLSYRENAHNYFLQIGAELGMAGLIAFLWILAVILKFGVSLFLYLKERHWKLLVGGLITGILGFLLTCLTDHPLVLLEMQFIFWLVVAILFTLYEHLLTKFSQESS